IQPHFIVLKPNLVGGFAQTENWIKHAEKKGIKWWITSALESNIGLNAIAQFAAGHNNNLHSGLGTGQLYLNNFNPHTHIRMGYLWRDMGTKKTDTIAQPGSIS